MFITRFLKIVFLILFLFANNFVFSQKSKSYWNDYLPYCNVVNLKKHNNNIFAITNYSFFIKNLIDDELNKISKVNYLNDIEISAFNINSAGKCVIGYSNGNIDVFDDYKVSNIPDFKNKQIQGNKKITHISFNKEFAYLSTSVGIIVINLEKNEIKDLYSPEDLSNTKEVTSSYIFNDTIYVSSLNSFYCASVHSSFLNDPSGWTKKLNFPYNVGYVTDIIPINQKLLLLCLNATTNKKSVVVFSENKFTVFKENLPSTSTISVSENSFCISQYSSYQFYNQNFQLIKDVQKYPNNEIPAIQKIIFENDKIWIADSYRGLITIENNELESDFPNSPWNIHVSSIISNNGRILVTGGGKKITGENLGYPGEIFLLENGLWHNYINYNSFDYSTGIFDRYSTNTFYIGSWGNGIYKYENNKVTANYNEENSSLQSIVPGQPYIRISSMAFDYYGNLWSLNHSSNPLCVKTRKDEWHSFSLNGLLNGYTIGGMIITQSNLKFGYVNGGGGVWAYFDNNTISNPNDDKYSKFQVIDEEGKNVGRNVYSIAEDKEGTIWVGTDEGIAVYYNPDKFYEPDFCANRIKITARARDTVYTNYLLFSEVIKCITVDGGNRKWIGTQHSGAFLISADGTEEIQHFTKENSNLISNNIISIAINDITGEVFFGTDQGIVSWLGDATEGRSDYKSAYVFPNPVKPDYTGNITITGLVENTTVKITDVTGALVYETKSNGGTAVWTGNTRKNTRVNTGVYLVFCSNSDGTDSCILKIVVIN